MLSSVPSSLISVGEHSSYSARGLKCYGAALTGLTSGWNVSKPACLADLSHIVPDRKSSICLSICHTPVSIS